MRLELKRRRSIPRGKKHCYFCDEIKPLAEFYHDRDRPSGRMSRCKACDNYYREFKRILKGGRKRKKQSEKRT
jgi:hypothetical protein